MLETGQLTPATRARAADTQHACSRMRWMHVRASGPRPVLTRPRTAEIHTDCVLHAPSARRIVLPFTQLIFIMLQYSLDAGNYVRPGPH